MNGLRAGQGSRHGHLRPVAGLVTPAGKGLLKPGQAGRMRLAGLNAIVVDPQPPPSAYFMGVDDIGEWS